MPANFSSFKTIVGDCAQCGRLCKRCQNARKTGVYRYRCNGCRKQMRGRFEDLRDLADVLGRSFCQECMLAFYGRHNSDTTG